MPVVTLSTLGPFRVLRDDRPMGEFGYAKVRALLAYLAVESGRAHPRAHLCALLWPDQPDRASRRNLSQALTQLRRAFDGAGLLLAASDDVQLSPEARVEVDVAQFLSLLAACERHAHHHWHTCALCAERLQTALHLYRGDFLVGLALPDSVPFEEWALLWRERLRQRALTALERLAAWFEWRGDFAQAAAFARRQVALDPLNEATQRDLLRLLALNGETAAAAAQFDQLRRLLAAELGLSPEPATLALAEQLRAGRLAGLRRFQPPPFEVPSPPTRLVGRAEDLADVVGLLRGGQVRALTLTGPPGIGKTRLALQAAADLRFNFAGGVHLVELAPLDGPAEVLGALARRLDVKEAAGQTLAQALITRLRRDPVLIVLDNFEHVLAAAAFVAELLAGCPALTVLATSRVPLNIRAEQPFVVGPLSAAAAQQLFIDRLGPAQPGPAPAGLAEICRRLDHLPLALELIAVRARALPLGEILRQLEHPLGALTSALRDLPERHRTLRAAIAWSYDRLSPLEQRVFRRLAVFVEGAGLAAVQAVAAEPEPVLPVLEALHAASLLQLSGPPAAELRFSQLATLREFALEQLDHHGEAPAALGRHLAYFLELAERAAPALEGAEQGRWLDQLEQDHANLRAALAHARARDDDAELRLAAALGTFWEVRGHLAQGRAALARALERRPGAPLPLRLAVTALAGKLAYRQGDYAGARPLFERSLRLAQQLEDGSAILIALRRLGTVAHDLGDLAAARSYYDQSLSIARGLGDELGRAGALNNLGLLAADEGDYARARALHEASLLIYQQLGDQAQAGMALLNVGLAASNQLDYPAAHARLQDSLSVFQSIGHKWGQALALLNLANLAIYQDDYSRAQLSHQASLDLFRELGDQAMASYPLFGLGQVAFQHGRLDRARALYAESLRLRREARENLPIPRSLEGLGQVERAEGRPERAARLFGAAAALRESQGVKLLPKYRPEYEREVAALRAALGAAAFDQAWAAGRALTPDQAADVALAS